MPSANSTLTISFSFRQGTVPPTVKKSFETRTEPTTKSIYEEYLRWGHPRWFHFVTGSLELTTAVLLARAQTRLWGAALGCTVMLAALATVTLHGEYGHGVAPLVAAALSILVGWIAWRKRLSSSE
jgi:hypothetical protein